MHNLNLPVAYYICKSQQTVFEIMLKFSFAVRLRGHKQKKLNYYVYSFLLFVLSRFHSRHKLACLILLGHYTLFLEFSYPGPHCFVFVWEGLITYYTVCPSDLCHSLSSS